MRFRCLVAAVSVLCACEPTERDVTGGATATTVVTTTSATVSSTASAPVPRRPPMAEWKMLARGWMPPQPIPNFQLTNHHGKNFRMRDVAQGHVFVGLIFTSCSIETACPLTTQKMFELGKLWKTMKAEGKTGDKDLHLLTLTFDPENDTPEVLAEYGKVMLAEVDNWTFATGPVELMEERLPEIFGVLAKDHPKAGKAHNVKAALLGPGLVPLEEWKDNAFDPGAIVKRVLD